VFIKVFKLVVPLFSSLIKDFELPLENKIKYFTNS